MLKTAGHNSLPVQPEHHGVESVKEHAASPPARSAAAPESAPRTPTQTPGNRKYHPASESMIFGQMKSTEAASTASQSARSAAGRRSPEREQAHAKQPRVVRMAADPLLRPHQNCSDASQFTGSPVPESATRPAECAPQVGPTRADQMRPRPRLSYRWPDPVQVTIEWSSGADSIPAPGMPPVRPAASAGSPQPPPADRSWNRSTPDERSRNATPASRNSAAATPRPSAIRPLPHHRRAAAARRTPDHNSSPRPIPRLVG